MRDARSTEPPTVFRRSATHHSPPQIPSSNEPARAPRAGESRPGSLHGSLPGAPTDPDMHVNAPSSSRCETAVPHTTRSLRSDTPVRRSALRDSQFLAPPHLRLPCRSACSVVKRMASDFGVLASDATQKPMDCILDKPRSLGCPPSPAGVHGSTRRSRPPVRGLWAMVPRPVCAASSGAPLRSGRSRRCGIPRRAVQRVGSPPRSSPPAPAPRPG
jgi:hypothetical protein